MPNRLNVPPELASLIEKREDSDRRHQQDASHPQGSGRQPDSDSAADAAGPDSHDNRRSGQDRRSHDSSGEDDPLSIDTR